MKNFVLSAIFGLAALSLLNYTSAYTGIMLPVSILSIGISGVLGIPGVVLMLLLQVVL